MVCALIVLTILGKVNEFQVWLFFQHGVGIDTGHYLLLLKLGRVHILSNLRFLLIEAWWSILCCIGVCTEVLGHLCM